jgi:hypothetical protein
MTAIGHNDDAASRKIRPGGAASGAFLFKNNPFPPAENTSVLLICLSFSMTKFSDPGDYNCDIRDAMKTDLQTVKDLGGNPFLYVQWEIADAIQDITGYTDSLFREFLPADHVCEPHLFTPEQILLPRMMLDQILVADSSAKNGLKLLKEKMERFWNSTGISVADLTSEREDKRLQERLSAGLNGLLSDPSFWKEFYGSIKLENLERQVRDLPWTEFRELPSTEHLVRKYQARRLGAFIIEALFGGIVKPTDYISTRTVLDSMKAQTHQERFMPDLIYLYAHEAHGPRARWQLVEKVYSNRQEDAWRPDWLLEPDHVVYRGGSDRWGQPGNAQNWTDNLENWNKYNGIEAAH